MKFVFDIVENYVEKEENAGHQHFPLPQCFQKTSTSGVRKLRIIGKRFKVLRISHHGLIGWRWVLEPCIHTLVSMTFICAPNSVPR